MKWVIFMSIFLFNNLWACNWMQGDSKGFCRPCRSAEVAVQDTWALPQSVQGVSSYNSDCHPSITADGSLMTFCAHRQNGPPYDTMHIGYSFNVYTARWNGTTWDSIRNVGRHINPASYPTISPGGDTLFYLKGNKTWMSIWQGSVWSNPVLLPYPVNVPDPMIMDGPCAISLDSRQLYFKSNRTGGYGSGDIWVVRMISGNFDSLTNVGQNVNTADMETHPAISPDGQRLYFSDFGGARSIWKFGDCDIYVSRWTGTEWGTAEILAAPVNSDLPACSAFETVDGRLYLGSEVSEGTAGEEDVWVCEPYNIPTNKSHQDNLKSRSWVNTADLTNAAFVYDLIDKDNVIYAATAPNGDVFKSSDGGNSWQNTGEISDETHIYNLLVAQDNSILAGTYPNGKIFRTTDNGTTWNEIVQFPYARAVRKIFQRNDGTLFAGTSPDSSRFGRVWRSTNNGISWQLTGGLFNTAAGIFCFYEVPGGLLAGGRTYGDIFYVSLNNGNSWNIQNLPYADSTVTLSHLYFFYKTSDNRLWTGGWAHGPQGILLSSTNNGLTWDTCGVIPNGNLIVARVFDMIEAQDGSYFIAFHPGPDSVVFRSTDDGVSWQNCGTLGNAFEALCLLCASDGTIYAGTTPNGDVFKYTSTIIEEGKNDSDIFLFQNQPNPFSVKTDIIYQLPVKAHVGLKIFNICGQEVKSLYNGYSNAGINRLTWDGHDDRGKELASGVYYCQLLTGNITRTGRLIYIK